MNQFNYTDAELAIIEKAEKEFDMAKAAKTRKIDTSSQEEITLDSNNVKEIREALQSQEKVANTNTGTKVNKLNLSREELLFGFYL